MRRSTESNALTPPPAAALVPLASRVRRGSLAAMALVAATALLASGRLPCATATVFGIPCPMCGATRAMWACLHGDIGHALQVNPAAPLVALLLGGLGLRFVWLEATVGNAGALGHGRTGRALVHGVIVALSVALVVWVARFFGLLGGPVPIGAHALVTS